MTQLIAQQVAPPAADAADHAGEPPDASDAPELSAPEAPGHAPLPLVALVLGIAGVVLGVTVVWFFAAIPIGIVAVVIGVVARRRVAAYHDHRAASRATIGTALGCVAILLGVTGAIFLPRVMDRADRFLSSIQQDVNDDVEMVNRGLSQDVDRLDRTLTRDLRRFEAENHRDLPELEDRTAATLKRWRSRSTGTWISPPWRQSAISRRSRPRCAPTCGRPRPTWTSPTTRFVRRWWRSTSASPASSVSSGWPREPPPPRASCDANVAPR